MPESERDITTDQLLVTVTVASATECTLACYGTPLCHSVQVMPMESGSVRCVLLAERDVSTRDCATDAVERVLDTEYVLETASRLYCLQCAGDVEEPVGEIIDGPVEEVTETPVEETTEESTTPGELSPTTR